MSNSYLTFHRPVYTVLFTKNVSTALGLMTSISHQLLQVTELQNDNFCRQTQNLLIPPNQIYKFGQQKESIKHRNLLYLYFCQNLSLFGGKNCQFMVVYWYKYQNLHFWGVKIFPSYFLSPYFYFPKYPPMLHTTMKHKLGNLNLVVIFYPISSY